MLRVIVGPMYSGKTTELINSSERITNPLVIQWKMDNREFNDSNHNGQKIKGTIVRTSSLLDSYLDFETYQHIFIDDAHFFTDLYICVNRLVQDGKHVLVCGLDGDYQQMPFEQLCNLVTISDTFEKYSGYCTVPACENKSSFTIRKPTIVDRIVPGNSDIYKPVCRTHLGYQFYN